MKYLIWETVYKIVCKLERAAFDNGLTEQVSECRRMQAYLTRYKNVMQDKGI